MSLQDGVALAKELNDTLKAEKPNCGVVICTPFIHLASIAQFLDQSVIGLGAENCADKEKGAYTGEVSAEMVKSTGAQYVILGHSERRGYYGETPEILKEKVLLALKNGLKVIFCIGESLEEREANKQNEVVKAELEGSVFNLSAEPPSRLRRFTPTYAVSSPHTTERPLPTRQQSSTAEAARQATRPSCSQSPTSTADSSAERRSRPLTSRASSTPGNNNNLSAGGWRARHGAPADLRRLCFS